MTSSACRNILKASCNTRFQRAFTVCYCIFKVITLVRDNQCNYFENAKVCSKRTLKMLVAIRLTYTFEIIKLIFGNQHNFFENAMHYGKRMHN